MWLPHSGLTLNYSIRHIKTISGKDSTIIPEIYTGHSFEDYARGFDPVTDKIEQQQAHGTIFEYHLQTLSYIMKHTVFIITVLLLGGSLTSCVSNKKYLAAKGHISGLQQDSTALEARLSQANSRINTLEGKVDQMQATNQFTSNQLNQSQEEIASQRQRLEQLQARIDQQRKNTEAIRAKMAEALKGFSSDQLSIAIKKGKVYVSMQESLLFPSGSAVVNAKGKEALGTLSQVLNLNPDINVLVEGHTDSIPIRQRYEDNLALSVARSTAIERILTNDYKVAPERVTASGRSQYEPIADNATPDGRARNRRTEIILEPKLDELMRLIEGSTDKTD